MLPSTGNFKEYNCPFYDSGLCERPYCHFRHVRKDTSEMSPSLENNGEMLKELVSAAVKKVLRQNEILPGALGSSTASNPAAESPDLPKNSEVEETESNSNAPSYRPTPISQLLKKRHIPIPYSPTPSKSISVVAKKRSNNDSPGTHKKAKFEEYSPSHSSVEKCGGSDSLTHKKAKFEEYSPKPEKKKCEEYSPIVDKKTKFEEYSPTVDKKTKFEEYSPSAGSSEKCGGNVMGVGANLYSPTLIKEDSKSITFYSPSSKVSPIGTGMGGESPQGPILNRAIGDYDPSDSSVKGTGYSVSESSTYSPSPLCGWTDTSHSYTPSSLDALNTLVSYNSQENVYIPSSNNPDKELTVKYNPSTKSEASCEPTYVPVGGDKHAIENATYKPSSVSLIEPEYQPKIEGSELKEYVPTNISALDNLDDDDDDSFSSEIDLLHEIVNEDLNDTSSRESENVTNKQKQLEENVNARIVVNSESHIKLQDNKVGDLNGESRLKDDTHSLSSISAVQIASEKDKASNTNKLEINKPNDEKSDSNKKSDNSKKKLSPNKQLINEKNNIENDKKHSENDGKGKKSDKIRNNNRKESETDRKHSESDRKRKERDKVASENKNKKSKRDKSKDSGDKKRRDSTQSSHKQKISDRHKSDTQKNKDTLTSDLSKRHKENKGTSKDKQPRSQSHSHSHRHTQSHSSSDKGQKGSDTAKDQEKSVSSSKKSKTGSSKSSTRKHSVGKGSPHKKRQMDDLKSSRMMHRKEKKERREVEESHGSGIEISESDEESGEDVTFVDDVTLPSDMGASSSEEDEDAVTKECFRIFQEYEPAKISSDRATKKPPHPDVENDDELQAPVRKRVARDGAQHSSTPWFAPPKRAPAVHPGQVMTGRIQKMRASMESQLLSTSVATTSTSTSQSPVPVPTRVRIAHVPNVSLLLNAKLKMQQKIQEQHLQPAIQTKSYTISQSGPRGGQRIAHVPSANILSRPVISDGGGKIPANVRQKYLNAMVDEHLKLFSSEAEAFEKAVEEEKSIFARSTTRPIYMSLVSNTISRLRKSCPKNDNVQSASSSKGNLLNNPASYGNRTVSHTSVLAGKSGAKGSWSILKPKKSPAIAVVSIYQEFSRHVMTEELLKSNGYPFQHPEEKGAAIVHAFYKKPFVHSNPNERMCSRCSKVYSVNKKGFAVQEESCIFHWGRLFQMKVRGTWEARYSCCQSPGSTVGCAVSNCHVSDNFDPNCMRGFVKTLPKDEVPPNEDYGVYALDCEMCYTTMGLELTRITVINSDLGTIYETLVKPENPILDYNTRYSGITEDDLADVTTSIYEVQSALLSFINDKTILVGHSLESDFKALKLIHATVVDTSVVFPHKLGPPKKKALKTLCRELLQKIIQEGDEGHDSAEDAKACMELMLYKVKEELKSR